MTTTRPLANWLTNSPLSEQPSATGSYWGCPFNSALQLEVGIRAERIPRPLDAPDWLPTGGCAAKGHPNHCGTLRKGV